MSLHPPLTPVPPKDNGRRLFFWALPILLIAPGLVVIQRYQQQEDAEIAQAERGRKKDPTSFLKRPPEEFLCSGDAPAVCDKAKAWKQAKDCASKRAALGELKSAVAEYESSPSFIKLAGGVVNIEAATRACKDIVP